MRSDAKKIAKDDRVLDSERQQAAKSSGKSAVVEASPTYESTVKDLETRESDAEKYTALAKKESAGAIADMKHTSDDLKKHHDENGKEINLLRGDDLSTLKKVQQTEANDESRLNKLRQTVLKKSTNIDKEAGVEEEIAKTTEEFEDANSGEYDDYAVNDADDKPELGERQDIEFTGEHDTTGLSSTPLTAMDLANFEDLDDNGDGEIDASEGDLELGEDDDDEEEEVATYEQKYGALQEADEEDLGEGTGDYYKVGESGDGEVTRSSRIDTPEQVEMKAEYKKIMSEYDTKKKGLKEDRELQHDLYADASKDKPGVKEAEILKSMHLRGADGNGIKQPGAIYDQGNRKLELQELKAEAKHLEKLSARTSKGVQGMLKDVYLGPDHIGSLNTE